MKQSGTGLRGLLPIGLFVFVLLFSPHSIFAKPRPPQPPWPEQNLAIFGWDSPYERVPWRGIALGEEAALLRESWSGYALTRDALAVEPVVIPVRDAAGKPVVATTEGAIRFWFAPEWTSATLGGKGPGGYARLLELVHWGGKGPETKWALYVDTDGGALYLSGPGLAGAQDFLKAGVSFEAGGWRLLTVSYSPTNTALYVDAEKVAEGPAMLPPAEWELGNLGLVVGSDAFAGHPAGGQFEELTMFEQWRRNEPWQKLYFKGTERVAWLGPLGTREEEAAKHALQTEIQMMTLQDGPPEPGEGEPGEDPGNEVPGAYGYTNGLWLEITGVSNGLAYVTIHGTVEHEEYELLSRETLTNSWLPEPPGVIGAEGQDWAETTVVIGARTNSLFLFARSYIDSDGDGLPDWWELENGLDPHNPDTGDTGVSDGYKDNDGDGWTNLEEYRNGTNPNDFDLPPPPRIVSATVDGTGTNVTIAWMSGGGPVQSYSIEQSPWDPIVLGSVNNTTHTFNPTLGEPLFGTPYGIPIYQVRANFGGGVSVVSDPVSLSASHMSLDMWVVRGQQGKLYLAVKSLPPNLARIRLLWFVPPDFPGFDIAATNLVNGTVELPEVEVQNHLGQIIYAQAMDTNGQFDQARFIGPVLGETDGVTPRRDYFVNAAVHSKENLKFLLSSATLGQPFGYMSELSAGDGWATGFFGTDPSDWFGRPTGNADYEYYGFRYYSHKLDRHVQQTDRPVRENHLWRNFVYAPSDPFTGRDYDFDENIRFLDGPYYTHNGFVGVSPPAPLFTNGVHSAFFYLLPPNPAQNPAPYYEVGLQWNAEYRVYLPSGLRNVYGLPLNSIRGTLQEVVAGAGPQWLWSEVGTWYIKIEPPVLETVDYYFASQTPYVKFEHAAPPPMPGNPGFSVTNSSPLLLASVGDLFTVAGWAKQAIVNGYAGKYAYLEQYFDKAYKVDANGTVTTNETGLLSPYGEFFPTEPGRAALVTMPDIDTGQRGTATVHVVKLQLDVNHDSVMDLSFGGPDNTSSDRPFVFWANNDYDRGNYVDGNDWEEDDLKQAGIPDYPSLITPDHSYVTYAPFQPATPRIPSMRDLEDYTRLRLAGLSSLMAVMPSNYTARLTLTGNGQMRIFRAVESDGGTNYLFDELTASNQVAQSGSLFVGLLTSGSPIILSSLTNLSEHFIWCGVQRGSAEVHLQILNGTNMVADTAAYIEIKDIKEMYERWTLGDVPSRGPYDYAYPATEDLPVGTTSFRYGPPEGTNTPYILLVHGWNMERWEKDRFAETAFKRLYWQGYQGRFGFFRWPTDYGFDGLWDAITDRRNYDNSEFNAWKSAPMLTSFLRTNLNAQYPGRVYLMAHSMGNVVAGEALRLATNQIVNTYAASQAAVPAHTYDGTIAPYSFTYLALSYGPRSPNIYSNWFAPNSSGAGQRVNFYNFNDYALQRPRWELNQLLKPDQATTLGWTYLFDGYPYDNIQSYTNAPDDTPPWDHFQKEKGISRIYFSIVSSLTDRYEVMSYAAQSRSMALGRTAGVGNLERNVDLARSTPSRIWPPDTQDQAPNQYSRHKWHSAQFRSTNMRQQGYWQTLLSEEGFDIAP